MPSKDLLDQFNLTRNPFTDRTAEKTNLDQTSTYFHSDLQGVTPSETTYIFFGRRGSGKTTIRMQMQKAYDEYNEQAKHHGSYGHFVADLCRPGHMTACLRAFQSAVGCNDDNWDAQFGDAWTSADMVDCILSFAATNIVARLTDPTAGEEGRIMLNRAKSDPRAAKQLLLLAHLYARTDSASLATLRRELLPLQYTSVQIGLGVVATASVAAGVGAAANSPDMADAVAAPFELLWDEVGRGAPALHNHPRITFAATAAAAGAAVWYYRRYTRQRNYARAVQLISCVRVVKQQPPELMARLLSRLFNPQDRVDTIRSLCIGISAHQKLDLLTSLVRLLGFESVAVFGDCFDGVSLLDPVQYPGAIKAFAKEVCRNDLLNFGRLHFFFPDSRLSLDLNTDKTLKEARFDRHFVRDLTWSRFQLEQLAERRFIAAQRPSGSAAGTPEPSSTGPGKGPTAFSSLFEKVRVEDFSSYLAKLSTPRELMIMMTEILARMEAHPDKSLEAQDMEIAVTKALEQAV